MISRTWHGCVPLVHKQGFYDYELITGVVETKQTIGNIETYLEVIDQEIMRIFFSVLFGKIWLVSKNLRGIRLKLLLPTPKMQNLALFQIH